MAAVAATSHTAPENQLPEESTGVGAADIALSFGDQHLRGPEGRDDFSGTTLIYAMDPKSNPEPVILPVHFDHDSSPKFDRRGRWSSL